MSDYDKIMESIDNTKGLILGLIFDIIKLIFFGARAIELICNWFHRLISPNTTPTNTLQKKDTTLDCWHVFIFWGLDPVVACEKIRLATDQRFSCYDREEENISLMNYNEMYHAHPFD